MDTFDKVSLVVLAIFFAFCVTMCNAGTKQSERFRQKCEAADGVPLQPKNDWICLKKDQVQEMQK